MKPEGYNVAVVGVTGAVGRTMLAILEERRFPVRKLLPLASERSRGTTITFQGKAHPVQVVSKDAFRDVDLALFSAGGEVSKRFAPIAAREGAWVVDNTSAFRMDEDVPLIVPEVNAHTLNRDWERRIIANPNCSTIQMVVALAPLHAHAKIKRVSVATYQSTSGAGHSAMEELQFQTRQQLEGKGPLQAKKLPHVIAFNCIPHIDVFLDDGFTKEEQKMMQETVKIMEDPSIKVVATCVRVPVVRAHSEAVVIECERALRPERAREILSKAPGVEVVDEPAAKKYPLAIDAAGKDAVFVGRIRRDPTVPHGLALWIVADNLRKGAALNAIQIAELLHQKGLL
ncbi:MAG: aspartate-semialdehyde dehydrogenase [Deltaproteobacteria bacterium]|nr:aspartate-semialdehyde dehydrogenase [Deltaproteobacteria bacterium]